MVAVFTGLGAGFERGSAADIGPGGILGGGIQGRGGDNVSVNGATGNLLVNRQDEFLVGLGPDAGVNRTYNSLGVVGDTGDNWRQSTERRLINLIGSPGSTDSQITRISADGSEIVYTLEERDGETAYWATDGAGAHDKMTHYFQFDSNGGDYWRRTDGDTGITELYFGKADKSPSRLVRTTDQSGNSLIYTYVNSNLSRITTADGGYLQYTWSGGNIMSIETYADGGAVKTLTRTYYDYDNSGRLIRVKTDLTPDDNALSVNGTAAAPTGKDFESYITTYAYEAASDRLASISQTDGSVMSFTYVLHEGEHKVETITQVVGGDEDARVTRLVYNAGFTQITDPSDQTTTLKYDGENRLIEMTLPAGFAGDNVKTTAFSYDTDDNLIQIINAEGEFQKFKYDERGNINYVMDAVGNMTTNVYDDENNLISSTRTYDPDTEIFDFTEPLGGVSLPTNLVSTDNATDLLASFSAHNGYNGANYTQTIQTVDGREAIVLDTDSFHEYANGSRLGGYHTIRQGDLEGGKFYSVAGGEMINFGFEAKEMIDTSGSGKVRALAYFYDADGTYISGGNLYVTEGGEWTAVSQSLLAPENAVKVLFNVYIYGRDANTSDPEPTRAQYAVRNFHLTREAAPQTEVLVGGLPTDIDSVLYSTTDWGGGATVDVQIVDGSKALVFDDTGFYGTGWDHGSSHWISGGDLNGGTHYSVQAGINLLCL